MFISLFFRIHKPNFISSLSRQETSSTCLSKIQTSQKSPSTALFSFSKYFSSMFGKITAQILNQKKFFLVWLSNKSLRSQNFQCFDSNFAGWNFSVMWGAVIFHRGKTNGLSWSHNSKNFISTTNCSEKYSLSWARF